MQSQTGPQRYSPPYPVHFLMFPMVPNCIEVAEKVNLVSLPTTFSPESMNRTNLIPILSSPTYPSLPLIFAEPLVSLSPPPLSYKFEFTQRLGWLLFGRWVVMNRSSLLNIANIAFAFLRIVLPVLFILCALFLFHAPILVAFFLILFGDCHDSKGPAVSLLRLLHYFIFYVCIREILVPPEEALQTHRPTL
jgi:hypothetical protein